MSLPRSQELCARAAPGWRCGPSALCCVRSCRQSSPLRPPVPGGRCRPPRLQAQGEAVGWRAAGRPLRPQPAGAARVTPPSASNNFSSKSTAEIPASRQDRPSAAGGARAALNPSPPGPRSAQPGGSGTGHCFCTWQPAEPPLRSHALGQRCLRSPGFWGGGGRGWSWEASEAAEWQCWISLTLRTRRRWVGEG